MFHGVSELPIGFKELIQGFGVLGLQSRRIEQRQSLADLHS